MNDELVWSYYLCDYCKHCRVQTGCLLGEDVGGWKVISDEQHPLDVCDCGTQDDGFCHRGERK